MGTSLFQNLVFQKFAHARPIGVTAQLVLRRLLDPTKLDELFHEHAQAQSERTLLFSALTHLVSAVVTGKCSSMNAGFAEFREQLGVSKTAMYEKLQRVEPQTTQALVRHAYRQVVEVRRSLGSAPRHAVPGYFVRILDGNHLSGTEHRLKETRLMTAAPLPGKSLVVYDPRYEAVVDVFPMDDGHAQERSELDAVIETILPQQLWIADRNFCTLKWLYEIDARGSACLVRHHQQLHGTERGKLRKVGKTQTGTVWENQLELPSYGGRTLTVRRIVVRLLEPTRDGDTEIVLLTNLPAEVVDAVRVAELYRDRWKIEKAFNHITLAYHCEIKPLCYPRAALFCFANALVAYNAVSIMNALIGSEHGPEAVSSLSHFYMASEITSVADGLLVALPEAHWSPIATMPIDDLVGEMRRIVQGIDLKRYRKSVRGPKKPTPKKIHNRRHVHVSVAKILAERH